MSDTSKTFFITGGGTGGHIYPAVAVSEELAKRGFKIFYVGNPDNLEFRIVTELGFEFLPIKIDAMPRKISLGFLKWLWQLECATWKALFYILKHKPDAVFGTGGYVSAPAIFAAILTKTPFMVHDCDAQPGIVSRLVAPCAKAVSLTFEKSKQFIKSNNIFVNGNPIRKAFATIDKDSARKALNLEDNLTVCIMGGSQGAAGINKTSALILKQLVQNLNLQVIFQTGAKKFQQITELLNGIYPNWQNEKKLIVQPYFDDMITVLKASDIAVSRAGSLSLSEICACAIAPILVPYPYAAADHQRKNARYMKELNACLYLEEADANLDSLLELINSLVYNSKTLNEIQENTAKLAKFDATDKIVEQLVSIAK